MKEDHRSYKLNFRSFEKCDHPNESYRAALSCGIVSAAQGGSFESVEEILKCDHNNESSAFLVLFLML